MNFEKHNFYCPNCKSQLDSDNVIQLKTTRTNGNQGEIHLSTSFGNYNFHHYPKVTFEKNEMINFLCPKCDTLLHSSLKPKFVNLIMRVENQFDFEILFSREAGVQKTYIVTEDGIESFGRDANVRDII
jgi:transcription initiation factor IIE alpha subunit